MKINNVPDYAKEYDWWVISYCDGEYWFYGAYSTQSRALEVVHIENENNPQYYRSVYYTGE